MPGRSMRRLNRYSNSAMLSNGATAKYGCGRQEVAADIAHGLTEGLVGVAVVADQALGGRGGAWLEVTLEIVKTVSLVGAAVAAALFARWRYQTADRQLRQERYRLRNIWVVPPNVTLLNLLSEQRSPAIATV